MTQRDYKVLISAYLDETLSAQQGEALNAWVKADPDHARELARAVWLHRRVYDLKHVEDIRRLSAVPDEEADRHGSSLLGMFLEMEREAEEPALVDLTEELHQRKMRKRYEKARRAAMMRPRSAKPDDIHRPLVIPLWMAYGVAALIAIGAFSAIYAGWTLYGNDGPAVTQDDTPRPAAPAPQAVATLSGGEDLRFADPRRPTTPGAGLLPGSLTLTHGVAEFTFDSGAVVSIAAPARIELVDGNLAALHEGTLAAVVPPEARGFAIDTPTMRVVDLGTQFGVSVDAGHDTEVQVFLGEVTAAVADAEGELGPSRSLRTSQGLRVDAASRHAEPIEVDGRGYDELLPHLKLLYRNLVVNGDFEQGEPGRVTGATQAGVQNLSIPGWEDGTLATVLPYDEASRYDYPNPELHPMPDNRGRAYFAGIGEGVVRQRIDVSALAVLTDAGQVRYDLSAWLGGFATQDEYLQITARFVDEHGNEAGPAAGLNPVRVNHRRGESGFMQRESEGELPVGTRFVVIEIENIGHHHPPYIRDGYADNIALELRVE